jgi:hypothetical protein
MLILAVRLLTVRLLFVTYGYGVTATRSRFYLISLAAMGQ